MLVQALSGQEAGRSDVSHALYERLELASGGRNISILYKQVRLTILRLQEPRG